MLFLNTAPCTNEKAVQYFQAVVHDNIDDFAQRSNYPVVFSPMSFLSAGERTLPDSCGTTNSFLLTAAAWFYLTKELRKL